MPSVSINHDDPDDPAWLTWLRNGFLVAFVLTMVWLAFTVELPELRQLRDRIESYGWLSGLAFTAAYAVVAITPIPVTIMAVTGGAIFGVLEGSALSVVGSMVGSIIAYWIARALGKDTVLRLLGRHGRTVANRLGSASFEAVFTLRLTPGIPYWPVNYAAGALGVPHATFVNASALAD